MLGQFARASSVTVYQNVFGVPSFDVKQDTFTLRTGDYQTELVDTSVMSIHPPDGGLYSPP